MEDGILVSHPRAAVAKSSNNEKRPWDKSSGTDAGSGKSPKHGAPTASDAENGGSSHVEEVVPSQYELEKNLIAERETRKLLLEKKLTSEKTLSGVEQVNAEFAKDTAMLEDFTEEVESLKEDEFDCTQDPDDFARRLGISPQRIKEINDAADKDLLLADSSELQSAPDKENEELGYLNSKTAATPPERVLYQKRILVLMGVQYLFCKLRRKILEWMMTLPKRSYLMPLREFKKPRRRLL